MTTTPYQNKDNWTEATTVRYITGVVSALELYEI